MEAQSPRARISGFVALDHCLVPNAAGSAVLGDLLKEIVMRVEEKGKLRRELIDIQPSAHAPFNVFQSVAQRECQLLDGGRSCLANVIAADGNGVELRRVFDAELERVNH